MRQRAEVNVESSRSLCCEAVLERALFSDSRGFFICTACGKVLSVEPKRQRKTA